MANVISGDPCNSSPTVKITMIALPLAPLVWRVAAQTLILRKLVYGTRTQGSGKEPVVLLVPT